MIGWRRSGELVATLLGLTLMAGCAAASSGGGAGSTPPARAGVGSVITSSPTPSADKALLVTDTDNAAQLPVYRVLNLQGVLQWSLNTANLATATTGFYALTAGDKLLVFSEPPAGAGAAATSPVWVFGANGELVGTGQGGAGSVVPGSSGREWAWSVVPANSCVAPSYEVCTGSVFEAGIGVAPHVVWRWTTSSNGSFNVVEWSRWGLVVNFTPGRGCGDMASEYTGLLNLTSGRVTRLVGADWNAVDVQQGMLTAINTGSSSALLVKKLGRSGYDHEYPATGDWSFTGAQLSPNDKLVAATMFNVAAGPCGGNPATYLAATIRARVKLMPTAGGKATTLPGVIFESWIGNRKMVVAKYVMADQERNVDGTLSVLNLKGKGAVIATANFVGCLQ